jgi:hypothetical protein
MRIPTGKTVENLKCRDAVERFNWETIIGGFYERLDGTKAAEAFAERA